MITIVAMAALGSSAHADDDLEKARLLAARGRAFHDGGDYAAAIEAYNQAYALAPRPGLLFNLAQAYRLAGNCPQAADLYRRYLETAPTDEGREIAQRHLEHVEHCPIVTAQVEPMPVVANAMTSHGHDRTGVWLAIGGGAALAVAAGFAIDAYETAETVDDAYRHGTVVHDLSSTARSGQDSADIASVFGIAGGLAVLSGALLYAIDRRSERANHATVAPTSHGGVVRVTWLF